MRISDWSSDVCSSDLDAMIVGDIRIKTVDQPHGNIFSTGFRFETIGSSISYSTDFHVFTDAMLELFSRTDIWVVDALRERPHPTHINLGATLDAILAVQPGQAILTHMDHSMEIGKAHVWTPVTNANPGCPI